MTIRQKIEQIYELLARIPVTGGNVDLMAAVRQELREVHQALLAQETQAKPEPEEVNEDG